MLLANLQEFMPQHETYLGKDEFCLYASIVFTGTHQFAISEIIGNAEESQSQSRAVKLIRISFEFGVVLCDQVGAKNRQYGIKLKKQDKEEIDEETKRRGREKGVFIFA